MNGRPAAFLDRDGTIIVDADYPNDPDGVELLPGAAHAIARLNAAGMPVVVITNQSGIARGLVTNAQYEAVRARVAQLLAAEGARLDATYHCPHHPEFSGPCECRKPGTLLYTSAAADMALDPEHSFYVGDRWRDVAPALSLGGSGILVPSRSTPAADLERAHTDTAIRVMHSLGEAVDLMLALHAGGFQ